MKKNLMCIIAALAVAAAIVAQTPNQAGTARPAWVSLPADKEQPPAEDSSTVRRIPGTEKTYTLAEIGNLNKPPDWFPDEHAPLPKIIAQGDGPAVPGCGACHLMSGMGHPESADLAGLPAEYIRRQMADFKSGARVDPARMSSLGKAITEEDVRQASEWFATLKPLRWIRVVEATTVPKSIINTRRMRLPLASGGVERLGNRIIELPEDAIRMTSRDPHSGFVAYVPVGSVAKGKDLVSTGGGGKTITCTICHGDALKGLGSVPRIAGLHPVYIVRQLYNFKDGTSGGSLSVLMKKVVANMTEDDMIAVAAYTSSLAP